MIEQIEYGTNWALLAAAVVLGIGIFIMVTALFSSLGGGSPGDRWSIGFSLVLFSILIFMVGLALVGAVCGIYAVGVKVWSQIVLLNSPNLPMRIFVGACLLGGAIWQIFHWLNMGERFGEVMSGFGSLRDVLSLLVATGFPIVACLVAIVAVITIDYQLAMGHQADAPIFFKEFVGRGMFKAHVWFGNQFPSESPGEGWVRPLIWVAIRGIPYWLAAGVSSFVVFLYATIFARFSMVAIAVLCLQQALAGHFPDIAAYFKLLIQLLFKEEWDPLAAMLVAQSVLQTLFDFRRR